MTNSPNFISQLKPVEPKEIMAEAKTLTGISILSGGRGASVTPEKRTPRKKRNMKSPEMSPLRMDPIPNQHINRLITEQ